MPASVAATGSTQVSQRPRANRSATGVTSALPTIGSAATVTAASAQVTTCGRPGICPVVDHAPYPQAEHFCVGAVHIHGHRHKPAPLGAAGTTTRPRSITCADPASIPAMFSAVNRRANPAAVVEARNGTADTSAATASARTWSRPDQ